MERFSKSAAEGLQQSAGLEDALETASERRERWHSIYIIYFTMFLISLGFGIILTGVWPYLDKLDPSAGKEFMGYVVAANPLAQMLLSPLFGWWSNRLGSIRLPVLVSLALFTIASALYSSLEHFQAGRKYWMLTTRLVVGVSSACIAPCRSYVSAATKFAERTKAVSMISLAQVLGFIIGPILQAVVVPLGNEGVRLCGGWLKVDMYTACGWINVLLSAANFCLFLPCCFRERKIAAREAMRKQGVSNEKDAYDSSPDYLSAWTLIAAFFVLVFNFMLLETLGTPLTMDQFAWTKGDSLYYMGIMMSIGGVISIACFLAISPLCRFFAEHKVMIWGGFLFMVAGRLAHIPVGTAPPLVYDDSLRGNNSDPLGCPSSQRWCERTNAMTLWQFVAGYILTCFGYPVGVTLIQTIFSKVLGPRPQGVWMGLLTGAGCFSRVLGPVFVTYVYTEFGTHWTFGFTAAMMLISMVWLVYFTDRLDPKEPATAEHEPIELKRYVTVSLPNVNDI